MVIPVTTIGGGKDDEKKPSCDETGQRLPSFTPTTIKPTSLSPGLSTITPAAAAPQRSTAIAPTQIGEKPSPPMLTTSSQVASPTVMPPGMKVSGIGGAVSLIAVSLDTLAQRFPDARPDALARVRALLLPYGSAGAAADQADWLTFGVASQSLVTAILRDQVALLESPGRRDASAHVARLHEILTDVLGAMEGGFFRKSAHTVWQQHSAEISHLETLLTGTGNELRRMLRGIADLARRYDAAGEDLESHFLAGQYLFDGMRGGEKAHLLQSRLIGLTASQTLVQENRLLLQQQETGLQELAVLIQDGVLVKLPSVVTQIAALPDRPTDTDRYLAREALSNLTQLFERSRTWH